MAAAHQRTQTGQRGKKNLIQREEVPLNLKANQETENLYGSFYPKLKGRLALEHVRGWLKICGRW